MTDKTIEVLSEKLDRLIAAVRDLGPAPAVPPRFDVADCFVWQAERKALEPVENVNRVELSLIRGVDRVRDILADNTDRFAKSLPANNVLLWGARGRQPLPEKAINRLETIPFLSLYASYAS